MPRSGDGVYTLPANTAGVSGQTIASAKYNTLTNDIANDLNTARPITAGGTGATNAADALANLGGVGQSNILAAMNIGDGFYSLRDISAEGGVWLRRDGNLYDVDDYPELAALLPALPDGVQWSLLSAGASASFKKIFAGPTFYLLFYNAGADTYVFKSDNGTDFSQVAQITGFLVNSNMAYGGGIYVIGSTDGRVVASNDGVTWGSPVQAIPPSSNAIYSIAYGAGVFAVGGLSGKLYTSPDAVTWTSRTSNAGGAQINALGFFAGNFLGAGSGGAIISSPDGTTWTARTSGTSASLEGVTYGNLLYVAVGASGTILTSPTLTTWTSRTSGTSQTLWDAAYSTAGFITVGGAGTARLSPADSGTTWTASATGASSTIFSIAVSPTSANEYRAALQSSSSILKGIRTLPTQFQVPSDSPANGWIKAEDA